MLVCKRDRAGGFVCEREREQVCFCEEVFV
jgi:hypothetical protein